MNVQQYSASKKTQDPVQVPLVYGVTVPHPMDPDGNGDRRLVMVWEATGKRYPKMQARWVYRDDV